ncbi:hypothetical protein Y032_0030g2058 [Ancylostoma ceylanicum]|uniref:Uncharacterized protein n=1 Tax=Ancylostoma ceylanicum TaxID=53326 RepID=A0A016URB6_9BILA|nr:hypothetical protein Y032_0030g2058 [Ancylostoma ceylanicum]
MIDANEEPREIQFDHLIKVPEEIDDEPINIKTRRKQKPRNKELNKALCKMIIMSNSFFRNKRATAQDVNSIEWRCPEEMKHGENSIICSVVVPILSVIPETPLGALTFATPYELGRLISIMRMTHVPESWRVARILDNCFDHLSVVGLGIAIASFKKKCTHVSLASVRYNSQPVPIHPPRSDEDHYNMALLYERAVEFAGMNPWNENMLKDIPAAKILILLPRGFEKATDSIRTSSVVVKVYYCPEDIEEEGLIGEISAVFLFSPTEYAAPHRWSTAWLHLLRAVSFGTELIALPGPQGDHEWRRSMDGVRGLFDETIR